MCPKEDKIQTLIQNKTGAEDSRVRVGCVTLVRVSNGTIQSVTVGNQEQSDKDDHTIDRAELAVDGFDTSNTGRCEDVLVRVDVLVVALADGFRVEDMLVVAGNGGSVPGRGGIVRVFLIGLSGHLEGCGFGGSR